jgi:hypothetical protein
MEDAPLPLARDRHRRLGADGQGPSAQQACARAAQVHRREDAMSKTTHHGDVHPHGKRYGEHWMQNVSEHMHKGAFSGAAKAKGESTSELAHDVLKPGSHASAHRKKQAVLAENFAKARHGRR